MISSSIQVPTTISKFFGSNIACIDGFKSEDEVFESLSQSTKGHNLEGFSTDEKIDLLEELCGMKQSRLACQIVDQNLQEFENSSIRGLLASANAMHFEDQLEVAKSLYLKPMLQTSKEPSVFTNLGLIAIKENQLEQAKNYCFKALEVYPNHEPAWSLVYDLFEKKYMDIKDLSIMSQQLDSWIGKLMVANIEAKTPEEKLAVMQDYFQKGAYDNEPVSYTHLTLPTNREV